MANDEVHSLFKYDVNTPQFLDIFQNILDQERKKKCNLIRDVARAKVFNKLSNYFNQLCASKDAKAYNSFSALIDVIMNVCTFVLENCQDLFDREDFRDLLSAVKKSVKAAYDRRQVSNYVLFELRELEEMHHEMNASTKKLSAAKKKTSVSSKSLNDFRDLALLPSSKEVNQNNFNAINCVLVRGEYESVEKYLNDQFRLVREDYVGAIRMGLRAYREELARDEFGHRRRRYEHMRVYENVHFVKSEFSKASAVAYLVNFDPSNRMTIHYETTKVFMQGSLLMFSRNEFQDFFCAQIIYYNVNLLNTGKLYVTVEPNGNFNEDFLCHPDVKFTMIESDIFWKPYSSILQVLKSYSETNFPMREYIVRASSVADPPAYLHKFREWNVFGHRTKVLDLDTWPEANKVGLDAYQYQALAMALTKEFCVIQGPPGTGKTFLGLKIVQILLENMDEYEFYIRNPILIICFTNHALDQFLEGILQFDSRIIRVGGQSRSELLNPYNFKEKKALRRGQIDEISNEEFEMGPAEKKTKQMIGKYRRESCSILSLIDRLNKNLQILDEPKGILSFECLEEVVGAKNKEIIHSDFSLMMWLLDEKETPFPEPEDFDFLDELDGETVIGQNALKKELFGELFKTRERENIDENDGSDEEKEGMTYCISSDGLIKVCLHFKKELYSIVDQSCAEYMWAKRNLITLVQRYYILEDSLNKTLVDEMLIQKTSQKDLSKLPLDHRWNTYFHWVEAKKKAIKKKIDHLKNEYRSSVKEMEKYIQEEDLSILQTACVVGMTTTIAAGYHTVLRKLKPSVVIVEEAAEVLEAHIVASLNEFTEHVILIGDHKQLKPSTGVYELAKNYHLDCSLFERMINNGMCCSTLRVQHRMRPEISSLLRPSIYKKLQDHESVRTYESIKGVQKNVFFVDHISPECSSVEDPTSYRNQHEADFVLELCLYLINQGYDPESITLLTTYAAQNFLIRQGRRGKVAGIRSCVVDDYQGKENDIIILSLVRSNLEGDIGFLKVENRVCVALSRAKKGFYLIGNMSILSRSSSLWRKIREVLEQHKGIGTKLTLRCSKHGTRTDVAEAFDFEAVKGGGCSVVCDEILPCRHVCLHSCHITDADHENEFACKKMRTRTLECGHSALLPCSQKEYLCKEKVEFRSATCKHMLTRECFDTDISRIVCDNVCKKVLLCGHKCQRLCHPVDDHAEFPCPEVCGRTNQNCPKSHLCRKKCSEPCGECLEPQTYDLKCGHTITSSCCTNPLSVKCSEVCGKICPNCGSSCQKLCWEDCTPCSTEVEKIIEECGHYVNVPCSVTPSREMCNTLQNVSKKSTCGHDIVYGVPCSISKTDFRVDDYQFNCEAPCNTQLTDCGHRCSGTCGRCAQGRLHVGCGKRCNKDLICGHKCRYACGEICPPCSDYSLLECSHSNQRYKCGALYTSVCPKRCSWKCKHEECTNICGDMCDREPCYQPCPKQLEECGHPCVGFCGEPCPPVCRLCDRNVQVAEYARYVMLEDCGCTFESHVIETELDHQAQFLRMHRCPQCDELILNTMRFRNRVRIKYKQVTTMSQRIHGLGSEWETTRNRIVEKLQEFCNLEEKDLPGIQRIQEYITWIVRSKHHLINERDMVIIRFFVDLCNTIGRRVVGASNVELTACAEYQKGVELVSQVLNRIDLRVFFYNTQTMNGLRSELIRTHRILDYCTLLRETPVERLEENETLKAIHEEIRTSIYQPKNFNSTTDAQLDVLFPKFLKVEPNKGRYSFDDPILVEMKWSNFLDEVSLDDWYVCKSNHFYQSSLQNPVCPKC